MQNDLKQFLWFCNERESIRIKKETGVCPPWTDDDILHKHKFTNIDRRNDKGTKLLYSLCNLRSNEEKLAASMIYRFTGSNNNQIQMMSKHPFAEWFDNIKLVMPIFNMKAYQAGWPAGRGSGIQFMTKDVHTLYKESLNMLQNNKYLSITNAAARIAKITKNMGYKAMHFQSTETAKDLSDLTPWVDPHSECRMGPGAKKGLKMLKQKFNRIMEAMPTKWAQPQIVEHALCEYSKWVEFKLGLRSARSKPYNHTKQ